MIYKRKNLEIGLKKKIRKPPKYVTEEKLTPLYVHVLLVMRLVSSS